MTNKDKSRIQVTQGDITTLNVTAIVTAANEQLKGGGGVDGAVHSAAGPELVKASRAQAPCPTGQARITPGYNLQAQYVIHAVGPVYRDGASGEPDLLASAYRSSLALALSHKMESIAFPCISTGVYGYPPNEAARIATDTALQWISVNDYPRRILFCCFSDRDKTLYHELI